LLKVHWVVGFEKTDMKKAKEMTADAIALYGAVTSASLVYPPTQKTTGSARG
jgi:hypothetical protein